MDRRLTAAVVNNADWCAAIWRLHGLSVDDAEGLRCCTGAVPQFYPNVVTLDSRADRAAAVIRCAAGAPSFSVKDSFARLDLHSAGFVRLFDAVWLWRDPVPWPDAAGLRWQRIADPTLLAAWERAWRGAGEALPHLFRDGLLADRQAIILGGFDGAGAIRAGGIAYEAAGVLGVTNIFGSRAAFLAALAKERPDIAVVGYETGPDLDAAVAAGFERLGPLRIWQRIR
jgi:hypothetical protein